MCFVQNLIILIRNWTKRAWDHSLISLVTNWLHNTYLWRYDKFIFMKGTCLVFPIVMIGRILCCPVRYFIKFILETMVQGIVNLSFRNSVWKIFSILGWLPGIHVFVADITLSVTCTCNIMLVFGISGHSWSSNWMVCDGKQNKSNKW